MSRRPNIWAGGPVSDPVTIREAVVGERWYSGIEQILLITKNLKKNLMRSSFHRSVLTII